MIFLKKIKVGSKFTSKRVWKLDLHHELALESWACKKNNKGEILVYKNNASNACQNASKSQKWETKARVERYLDIWSK
jgi:hypothetical protein